MKKKRKLKMKYKIIILIFVVSILFGATMFVIHNFEFSKNKVVDSVTYMKKASLTPYVCLKQNDFLDNECFTDEKSYVTALINKIKLNLVYNVDSSKIVNYEYDYVIKVRLLANEKGDKSKIVYDNEEELISNKIINQKNNMLRINETIDLDFQKYNSIITEFKRNYVLSLDSSLIVTATIHGHADYVGVDDDMSLETNLTLVIPLTEQTVNINRENSTLKDTETKYKIDNTIVFDRNALITDIVYKLDFIVLIIAVITIFKLKPQESIYTRRLKKILKEYDRAIVRVKNLPPLKDLEIIEISSFTELLDVKDNLLKPILFYEGFHQSCSKFIILDHKEAYVYTLNSYKGDN